MLILGLPVAEKPIIAITPGTISMKKVHRSQIALFANYVIDLFINQLKPTTNRPVTAMRGRSQEDSMIFYQSLFLTHCLIVLLPAQGLPARRWP